jgi:protein SCO1/2
MTRRLLPILLAVVVVVAVAGCSGGGSPATDAPRTNAPTITASGVITAVDQPGVAEVDGFSLRTDDGSTITFAVGELDVSGSAHPASHFRSLMALSTPVRVTYRDQADEHVAIRVDELPAGAPASVAPALGALIPVEAVTPAPPLDLTTHLNTQFSLDSLRGHPVLVFFGYLKCPDVCPATFGTLIEVVLDRPDVRVVYVTVDPERDTVPAMASFLMRYGESFTGLTGTEPQIAATAADWGVEYQRLDIQVSGGHATYAVAHTADVFLVDPEGRYRGRFPFGAAADGIVTGIDAVSGG